jgi:hypothetical protein
VETRLSDVGAGDVTDTEPGVCWRTLGLGIVWNRFCSHQREGQACGAAHILTSMLFMIRFRNRFHFVLFVPEPQISIVSLVLNIQV